MKSTNMHKKKSARLTNKAVKEQSGALERGTSKKADGTNQVNATPTDKIKDKRVDAYWVIIGALALLVGLNYLK